MNADLQSKLEKLRSDYRHVRGEPFSHFFCPILFHDEDVPLCKAHIINLAFADSSRIWTVQRKDVDNFYGSTFEANFVAVQYHEGPNLGKTITDRKLSRRFEPKILVDDVPVEFFVARDKIPKHFTSLVFGRLLHSKHKTEAERPCEKWSAFRTRQSQSRSAQ